MKCRLSPLQGLIAPVLVPFVLAMISPLSGQEKPALEEEIRQFQTLNSVYSRALEDFEKGETGKATAAFEKCVEKMPGHAFAHYYLANILYIREDFAAALAHMEKALGAYDRMMELLERADQMKLDNMESFQRSLESIDEMSGSCRDARSVEFFGSQVADQGVLVKEAAEARRKAQERMKGHYHYFIGNVLFRLQRVPDAFRQYEEALRLDPKHASATNNLVAICYAAKAYPQAVELLDRAERAGLDELLNLRLKELVYKATGRPTTGILEEEFPPAGDGSPAVMRFALAVRQEGALPPLYVNAYVVFDPATGDAVLIDPGADDPRLRDFVQARDLKVKAVLNTHGHADHRGGNAAIASQFGAPVYAPEKDVDFYEAKPDQTFRGAEALEFGSLKLRVLSIPGHTAGSACLLIGNRLFSGDTLFKNDIGKVGADNPRQTPELRKAMIRRIRDSLLVLPGEVAVFPGHGKTTRIADEKETNPFLR